MTTSAAPSPTLSTQDTLKPLLEAIESSKDGNITTIRSLVLKVCSEPKLFAGYDQVMHKLASALEKGGPEGERIARTLNLFSYGVYRDYLGDPSPFLPLTDSHVFKLRQLTVMSIVETKAMQGKPVIPYQEFQTALDLSTGREVEEILISCVYAGVLGAKLCQKTNSLKLDPSKVPQARDVHVQKIPHLIEQLEAMRRAVSLACNTAQQKQQANAREIAHYTAFLNQVEELKKTNTERSRGWPAEGVFDSLSSTVRRQKRSRGGMSGSTDLGRHHA